jgi:hypothetical protein
MSGGGQLSERRDIELVANFPGQTVIDLGVPRDRRFLAIGRIHVYRVSRAFAFEPASALFQMPQEVSSLH